VQVACVFLKTGGAAAEVLALGKAAFDPVARPVEHLIKGPWELAVGFRGTDRYSSGVFAGRHKGVGVITLARQYRRGLPWAQHGNGWRAVGPARRGDKSPRGYPVHCTAEGAWSLTLRGNAPKLGPSPFFSARGRLLMRPHDSGIDQQILVFGSAAQRAEEGVPDPDDRPTSPAFMNRFILAGALRPVTPASARAQDPQPAVDKDPVSGRRSPPTFFASGPKILNPAPGPFAPLITGSPVYQYNMLTDPLGGCANCRYNL
jgi:hypothetical protein